MNGDVNSEPRSRYSEPSISSRGHGRLSGTDDDGPRGRRTPLGSSVGVLD